TTRTAAETAVTRNRRRLRTVAPVPGVDCWRPDSRYRLASHTRKTAPKTDVTTPVGTSTPHWPPRAARRVTSAVNTTRIPARALRGSIIRCRLRSGTRATARRTNAGAARPTNPSGPANATEHAVRKTARTIRPTRVRPTRTPSTAA